jgi:hypothetical protein
MGTEREVPGRGREARVVTLKYKELRVHALSVE